MHDAGFRRVAHHDFQVCAAGNLQHLVPFPVGIEAPADAADHTLFVHFPAVFAAPQVQGVQAFLLIDQLRKSLGNRLYQYGLPIVSNPFVRQVKKVINEGPQEISFPELQNFLGPVLQHVSIVPGLLQNLVIQLFHLIFPLVFPPGCPGLVIEVYNKPCTAVNTSVKSL